MGTRPGGPPNNLPQAMDVSRDTRTASPWTACAVVFGVVALLVAGILNSPLADSPASKSFRPARAMRVFPDPSRFNVLILPLAGLSGEGRFHEARTTEAEERLLTMLKASTPAEAGRLDAEFMLPARLPASGDMARDAGARHGASLVFWGDGVRAGAVRVSDLPPALARGPGGYVWTVPAVFSLAESSLPSCLARYALAVEALEEGGFHEGLELAGRAGRACAGGDGPPPASTEFLAASCLTASGDVAGAVGRLAGAISDRQTALAARRNLDILLAVHFPGFSQSKLLTLSLKDRLPASGAVMSEPGLAILMDNNFQGYRGALDRYLDILRLRLKPAEARLALGEALEVLFGDPAGALAQYEKAGELDPGAFEPAYRAAVFLASVPGGRERAAAMYERALSIRFDPWAAHNLAALLENGFRDRTGAMRLYRRVLAERPDFLPSILNLAVLCDRLDRLEEARELYRAALVLDPDHAQAHAELGLLLMNRFDDPRGAAVEFQKALELDPRMAGVRWYLARLQRLALDDPAAARENYLLAGRMDPLLRNRASDRAFYVKPADQGSDASFMDARGRAVSCR